jgi:hypothetical protein
MLSSFKLMVEVVVHISSDLDYKCQHLNFLLYKKNGISSLGMVFSDVVGHT